MKVSVRLYGHTDRASLCALLGELFAHYHRGEDVSRAAIERHLDEHLLAAESPIQIVVASHDGEVLGFAALIFQYSVVDPRPENSKQCQLKELYVSQKLRGEGIGQVLMAWVVQYAIDQGCVRMDWNVKTTNFDGIRFYERLGARKVKDRMSLRMSYAAMKELAG